MFFEKHTYVFLKTKVCFFRNIPMFFRPHREAPATALWDRHFVSAFSHKKSPDTHVPGLPIVTLVFLIYFT